MSAARMRYPWIRPVLVGVALVVVLAFNATSSGVEVWNIGFAVLALLIAVLASGISASQPGNRIAWLLNATSVVIVLIAVSSLVVESAQPRFSHDFWNSLAAVIYNTLVEVALYPVLLILFIFPTGHYLTRRWAWAGWLAGATTAAMLLVAAFSEQVGKIYDRGDEYWNLSNPIGFLPLGVDQFVATQAVTVTTILAVGGVVAMVVRYRRSELVVRQQIKWVVYAAGMAAVALFLTTMSSSEIVWNILPMTAVVVVVVAITVAITRYKLFEIDRLISRTISYAVVVALLGLVFATGVVWLPQAIGLGDSPLIVAVSTLAAAAMFNPVRKRVQHVVDRRFNRSSYESALMSEEFAAQLRQSHSIEELGELWIQTVNQSLQPEASGIWLNHTYSKTSRT